MKNLNQTTYIKKSLRTLADDPQYFGAYFNMARHNLFQIINALHHKFSELKFVELKDDEQINSDFWITNGRQQTKPTILSVLDPKHVYHRAYGERIYHLLRRYLPMLRIFHANESSDAVGQSAEINFYTLYQFIVEVFHQVCQFRNSFSHHAATDGVGNLVPRSYSVSQTVKEILKRLFERAPQYTVQRFKSTANEIDDTFNDGDVEHLTMYTLFDGNSLNTQGIHFLLCLFLEQRYAYHFLKKFNGFKNETITPFKATLRVFTAYTLRLPHDKLISSDPKYALLMDMLNELNKIPKHLYWVLSEKNQAQFNSIEDQSLTNILNNTNEASYRNVEHLLSKIVPLRRNEDRFDYFALSFFELTNAFDKLKFHLSIGKLEYIPYSKTILGEQHPRRIQINIRAFGKLADYSKEKEVLSKVTAELGLENSPNIYFVQFNPHYHVEHNKIGFQLEGGGEQLTKINLGQEGKYIVKQPVAKGFLSTHELPKILTMVLLSENKEKCAGYTVQNKIVSFLSEYSSKFLDGEKLTILRSKIALSLEPASLTRRIDSDRRRKGKIILSELTKRDEYKAFVAARTIVLQESVNSKINGHQLPSAIRDYLLQIKEPDKNKQITVFLKGEVSKVGKLLQDIDKNRLPKLGQIASFLTQDITALVIDPEVKQRITSIYHRQIQHAFAYFFYEKDRLLGLLSELKLFNNEIGHAFLREKEIMNSKDVFEFYDTYLSSKQRWLRQSFEVSTGYGRKKRITYQFDSRTGVPYSYQKRFSGDFMIEKWLENKKQMPIDLPITLFDDEIRRIFATKLNVKVKAEDKFSNMISYYLKDDLQPYYFLKRKYWHIKKRLVQEVNIQQLRHKDIALRYGPKVDKLEKELRFIQTKDRLVKLMCEVLLKENKEMIGIGRSIKLKDMFPSSANHPLNTAAIFTQQYHDYTIKASDNPAKVEYLKSIDREEYAMELGHTWKVKDFGAFRRFLNDRRLPALFTYFEGKIISVDLLMHELTEYDRYRETVFDEIFKLEKIIFDFDADGIKALKNAHEKSRHFNEIQFGRYVEWIEQHDLDIDYRFVDQLRNKFSHSEFMVCSNETELKISEQQQAQFLQNHFRKGWVNENYQSISKKLVVRLQKEIDKVQSRIQNKK